MILFFKYQSVKPCPVFPISAQQKIQEGTLKENLRVSDLQNLGLLLLGTNWLYKIIEYFKQDLKQLEGIGRVWSMYFQVHACMWELGIIGTCNWQK